MTIAVAVAEPPPHPGGYESAGHHTLATPPWLDGRSVVLAVLGGQSSAFVSAALTRAGASVQETANLSGARRIASLSGVRASVVFEPAVINEAMHAGLRALSRHSAVLVLGLRATTRERTDLLNSGADSVLRSFDPEEVVAALAAVLRRTHASGTRQLPQVLSAGDIRVHTLHRTATAAERTLSLTPLEFDLLAYFVAHAGEALSRDRLLEEVWGYDIGGRDTVTVHVRRLRRKLERDPSRPTWLQTVWGIGYRLNPQATTGPDVLGAAAGLITTLP